MTRLNSEKALEILARLWAEQYKVEGLINVKKVSDDNGATGANAC